MEQVAKLEQRLDDALAALTEKSGGSGEETTTLKNQNAELQQALKKARRNSARAQEALEETKRELEALREETQEQDALDEEDIEALNRQIQSLSKAREDAFNERRRSKQYVQHIRKQNNDLRKANKANVGDANLVNASLEAEMDLVKQERENDLTYLNDLLARLQPLVEGSDNG